jgi:DNA-binding NarL/FixJ family response regulator
MKKLSILLIDDHILIRETFSYLLNQQNNFEAIAAPGNPEEIVEMARQMRPDIILLDINMTPVNGFDMLSLLRKNTPLSKIIGLSTHSQPVYAKKMIRLGAKGYMTKNSPATEIIQAILQVSSGEIYLCKEVKDILADQVLNNDSENTDINALSEREIQVLKLLKAGQTSREIATELEISNRTVEVHRHHILKKLKMKNTVSAISYFNYHAL